MKFVTKTFKVSMPNECSYRNLYTYWKAISNWDIIIWTIVTTNTEPAAKQYYHFSKYTLSVSKLLKLILWRKKEPCKKYVDNTSESGCKKVYDATQNTGEYDMKQDEETTFLFMYFRSFQRKSDL